jgi:arylsulfatase
LPWESPATLARFAPGQWDPQQDPVELYQLDEDFSQSENLAAKFPDKVRELQAAFQQEAEQNQVFPLLAELAPFFGIRPPEGSATKFTYLSGVENIGPGLIPRVYGRSYVIRAQLQIPPTGAEGVVVAEGSSLGGFALYVEGGKLKHTYSFYGISSETLAAAEPLPSGKVDVAFEFVAEKPSQPATPGKALLFVNGKQVAEGRLERSVAFRFSPYAGMDIGKDNGLTVAKSYAKLAPFPFTATIDKVEFELK